MYKVWDLKHKWSNVDKLSQYSHRNISDSQKELCFLISFTWKSLWKYVTRELWHIFASWNRLQLHKEREIERVIAPKYPGYVQF